MTKIWFNGRLCSPEEAHLDVNDRGFLLGEAIFETLSVQKGVPIELEAHLQRLTQTAAALDLAPELDDIGSGIDTLLAANDLQAAPLASLRITLSGGPAPRGLLPPLKRSCTLLISATPMSAPAQSFCAVMSNIRINEMSPTAGFKHVGYLDKILAKRAAADMGADEALLLNSKGRLAEATTANVFIVLMDGSIVTPSQNEGALPGITRARLLKLAQSESLDIRECAIPAEVISQAEEIFLTNSLIGVCPLRMLDGRQLNEKGAIGRHLRRAYDAFIENEVRRYSTRRP